MNLPENYVVLGKGNSFQMENRFMGMMSTDGVTWGGEEEVGGRSPSIYYAAPDDSEVAALNGHAPPAPRIEVTQDSYEARPRLTEEKFEQLKSDVMDLHTPDPLLPEWKPRFGFRLKEGDSLKSIPEAIAIIEGKLFPKEAPRAPQDDFVFHYNKELPEMPVEPDPVNHPPHYKSHPSGVECIQITEHMGFSLGNAIKYIWRADLKHDAIEDLKKAQWYLAREIELRESRAE